MPCFRSGFVFLFGILLAAPVQAEYELIQYVITATTVDELQQQLESKSPSASFGQTSSERSLRRTLKQTRVRKSASSQVRENVSCEIESIEFTQRITIHMPLWVNKESADECLQKSYTKLWDEVLQHELRHYEIYRRLDNEVERKLLEITPRKSCDVINELIDKRYSRFIAFNEMQQVEFHRVAKKLVLEACR